MRPRPSQHTNTKPQTARQQDAAQQTPQKTIIATKQTNTSKDPTKDRQPTKPNQPTQTKPNHFPGPGGGWLYQSAARLLCGRVGLESELRPGHGADGRGVPGPRAVRLGIGSPPSGSVGIRRDPSGSVGIRRDSGFVGIDELLRLK